MSGGSPWRRREFLASVEAGVLGLSLAPRSEAEAAAPAARPEAPAFDIGGAQMLFNAHHSPAGAFATLTLGCEGARGGLANGLDRPANQDVFVGAESADGRTFDLLPFCGDSPDAGSRYDAEGLHQTKLPPRVPLRRLGVDSLRRTFGPSVDRWDAPGFSLTILSAFHSLPDPATAGDADQCLAFAPAVLAELEVDNRAGTRPRRACFGYRGNDPYAGMRALETGLPRGVCGVGQGLVTAVATDAPEALPALGFTIEDVLREEHAVNRVFGLGGVGVLLFTVPPGESRTFRIAIAFHRSGTVTSGRAAAFWYARLFPRIEDVAAFALGSFATLAERARKQDAVVTASTLSPERRFMLSHAIRSYYGSTQLLDLDGRPLWVVNEGEYRMMTTFDLAVDQLFFELRYSPWAVSNSLSFFAEHYSYRDGLRAPGDPTTHPGGVAFTHDWGTANVFSRDGYSSYELAGLEGCWSYMSHEELVNWVLCAAACVEAGDERFRAAHAGLFEECLLSLERRDHFDPAKRDGVMSLDSDRAAGGAEITTYDSLDISLGRARENVYLGVKTWAAYLALARVLERSGRPARAAAAEEQARRAARTIAAAAGKDGVLPALLDGASAARVIPAIEGLAYLKATGRADALASGSPYAPLVAVLRRHLSAVLRPGVCLFPDGGWKLSSTSNNSWLSKIYLCQHVARAILGAADDETMARADRAHAAWLLDPRNHWWAWSDQMVSGEAKGSRYYPRGVTAILWLVEGGA